MQLQLFVLVSLLSALASAIPRPDFQGNQGSLDVCSEESHYMKWPRVYFTVIKGKTCADALSTMTKDSLVVAAPKDLCKTQQKDAEIRICSLSHNETKRISIDNTNTNAASSNASADAGCHRKWHKLDPSNVDLTKVEFKPELFHGQCFMCPDPNAKESSEEEKSSSKGLDNCKESRMFRWPHIYFTVPAGQTCDVANTKKPSDLMVGPPTDLCKNPAGGDNFRICSLGRKEIKRVYMLTDGSQSGSNAGGASPSGSNPSGSNPSANPSGSNPSGSNPSGSNPGSNPGANPSGSNQSGSNQSGANQSGESHEKCHHKMMDYTKIDLTQIKFDADNFNGKCFICPKTN